jgi:hypothetical protein
MATVSLAFRFGFGTFTACSAGVILATMPPVLAMANTAMPDIPAMSLGALGMERLLAWKQERKSIGILSALALGLAAFARIHMILLLPCAALLLRDDVRILNVKTWIALKYRSWPVLGAVLIFGMAYAITHGPGTVTGPGLQWYYTANIRPNFRSYLIYWILAMPLGLACDRFWRVSRLENHLDPPSIRAFVESLHLAWPHRTDRCLLLCL